MTDDAVARLKAEAETWAADIRAGAVREMTGVSGWPERQMARVALLDSLLAALAAATQREQVLREAEQRGLSEPVPRDLSPDEQALKDWLIGLHEMAFGLMDEGVPVVALHELKRLSRALAAAREREDTLRKELGR